LEFDAHDDGDHDGGGGDVGGGDGDAEYFDNIHFHDGKEDDLGLQSEQEVHQLNDLDAKLGTRDSILIVEFREESHRTEIWIWTLNHADGCGRVEVPKIFFVQGYQCHRFDLHSVLEGVQAAGLPVPEEGFQFLKGTGVGLWVLIFWAVVFFRFCNHILVFSLPRL